jgi:nucleoid-associated protein YgaU
MSGGDTSLGGAARGGTYTVKKGDTITSISRQVYGSPARVRDILAANPDVKDPTRIKVGQKLNLP